MDVEARARWDDRIDEILAGDLTVAIAYRTPAAGAIVVPVTPLGLRDREAGTVSFTTSLGFGTKLERLLADPRIALAFHAREHGFARGRSEYVLVQGRARPPASEPDPLRLTRLNQHVVRHLGPPRRGRIFWNRWLREYYAERVEVIVDVERVTTWPDLSCAGEPAVTGDPPPAGEPEPQRPPGKGVAPRIEVDRAAGRLRRLPHVLLGFPGADGMPVVLPVSVGGASASGIQLRCARPLPPGGRRAGLLGHSYHPKLIGLESRWHTGWLEVSGDGGALYAPHTERGFKAPANKTLLLLVNGFAAKRGLRAARKAEAVGGAGPRGGSA